MPSLISWLDSSPEEQRRVREIIRSFELNETVDELGGRQVFVALSDEMFPGTSVLLSRARYLLFIPWLMQRASARPNKLKSLEGYEKDLIEAFLRDADVEAHDRTEGLIGRVAGRQIKQLPSTAYWSALQAWGILQQPGSRTDILERMASSRATGGAEADELAERAPNIWHPNLSKEPTGFLKESIAGGFRLTPGEASWLRERWIDTASGRLLGALALMDEPLQEADFPWLSAQCIGLSPELAETIKQAERFAIVLHGSQLLYTLMLTEKCDDEQQERIGLDSSDVRAKLDDWASWVFGRAELFVNWDSGTDFWPFVWSRVGNLRRSTPAFFDDWFRVVLEGRQTGVADDRQLRQKIELRELELKKAAQSRLRNPQMLRAWNGTPPGIANYRWRQVQTLIRDMQEGLGIIDAGA